MERNPENFCFNKTQRKAQIAFCLLRWHPTPVLLPGKSHGRRSLVGCSPWGRWESDTTERLHFHFSLSCIGEGDGGPLQCSCLENPRDRGAWWAAVYGVAQSRTRLKWLSICFAGRASQRQCRQLSVSMAPPSISLRNYTHVRQAIRALNSMSKCALSWLTLWIH